jgi:capsular exopolysaccharide synthesis family protein
MSSTARIHMPEAARLVDGSSPLLTVGRHTLTLESDDRSRLVFMTEPAGLAVEQYKILRRRLCTLHPQGGVILITSASPGEGKTLTSINLAWCLAESGQNTCLVDLDFRAPGVSRTLDCNFDEDGVEDVITGKKTIQQSVRQLQDLPLYILGVRNRRATPGELLSSSSITPLVAELRTMFRWIILDFAPIIPMADVGEVLPHVDGALMVIRSGKTEKAMIQPALEILGSKIWGVVVNDALIKGSAYYGHYGSSPD